MGPSAGRFSFSRASVPDVFSATADETSAEAFDLKEARLRDAKTTRAAAFSILAQQFNEPPNRGLYEHTHHAEDLGKFRAPSLTNIALTAPYMHDGSLATLDEVIAHYAAGSKFDHPNKSRILRPFRVTDGDKRDLVEFLKSLTDEDLLHNPRWSDPWTAEDSMPRNKRESSPSGASPLST
jgi:cytochrome c peroxidase